MPILRAALILLFTASLATAASAGGRTIGLKRASKGVVLRPGEKYDTTTVWSFTTD